jgi:hypothetical protein
MHRDMGSGIIVFAILAAIDITLVPLTRFYFTYFKAL